MNALQYGTNSGIPAQSVKKLKLNKDKNIKDEIPEIHYVYPQLRQSMRV